MRELTGSEVVSTICRRVLGREYMACKHFDVAPGEALAALVEIRRLLGDGEVRTLSGEDTLPDALPMLARVAETGSFDPLRFASARERDSLRSELNRTISDITPPPRSSRALEKLPVGLRGLDLGLAIFAFHIQHG